MNCFGCSSGMDSKVKVKPVKMRKFEKGGEQEKFYCSQHENQTLDYVREKREWCAWKKYKMHDVLEMMKDFIDPSDPDLVGLPNYLHAFQAAEMARKMCPGDYQMQIVALIHDLGKVLFKFNFPVWSVVGDTYIVGCDPVNSIIFKESLAGNEDMAGGKFGIYKAGCGLNELLLAYGHDEYLYQVLVRNRQLHKLTERYMRIIRYHSFYPWHTGGDYMWAMGGGEEDKQTLQDVRLFNKFDLYSKDDRVNEEEAVGEASRMYFKSLLDLFFPNKLVW